MPELHHLLDDLAGSPAPPSPLRADELFTTGRQRRRRRRLTGTVATALVPVLALTAAIVWWPGRGDRPAPPIGGSPTAAARTGAPTWAHPADATHAYALVPQCQAPCSDPQLLLGTDDGGRTWTGRGDLQPQDITVLGPAVLLTGAILRDPPYPPMRLSTDGGRSWSELPDGAAPVAAVPEGAALVCRAPDMAQPCRLSAVDPPSRRIVPLVRQPDLIMPWAFNMVDPHGYIEQGGDRIVVGGLDRRTGRPAVAVSGDRGQTWSVQAFTDLPCRKECTEHVLVHAAADGATLYATVDDTKARRVHVYRQQAGDAWARAGASIPYQPHEGLRRSFVAADGTHLIGLDRLRPGLSGAPERPGDKQLRYVALRGDAYEPVELDGLPTGAMPVRRAPDGVSFFAFDHTGSALYRSADGRRWTRVAVTGG